MVSAKLLTCKNRKYHYKTYSQGLKGYFTKLYVRNRSDKFKEIHLCKEMATEVPVKKNHLYF